VLLPLAATTIVIVALLWDLALPPLREAWERHRARRALIPTDRYDPGRERRAEQRARELLRSCVNEEEWAMYRDLGFVRVSGRLGQRDPATGEAAYAYLIYPHKPIVAYVPKTRRLLSEYCVEFPDLTRAISHSRLPDSDDVLAKWMALTGDEEHLIRNANMHLPGRQVDPGRVRRDLWRLAEWERQQRGSDSFEAHQT
jgi:hypothetical protein